jgi:uncharacterized protein YjbI with pentapeptide repeats
MELDFIGKWTFKAEGNKYVGLADASSGKLAIVEVESLQTDQLFNAYGTETGLFWLQASSSKYVTSSGDEYAATTGRDGNPVYFSFEDAGAGLVRIVDHGTDGKAEGEYYWNRENGNLKRFKKGANPPQTTLFQKIVQTPGLAEIQKRKVAMGYDLSGVYLAGADLTGVNFAGANLSKANLSTTQMQDAVFQGKETNLTEADLSGAYLVHAVMSATNLTGADLSGAVLKEADLPNALLKGADLSGADLTSAVMNMAHLLGATLPGAVLKEVELIGADFSGADLTNANFAGAAVENIKIPGAMLIGAELSNLDLSTATIDNGTNFTGAKMQNVNLENLKLDGVTMTHADLTGANLTGVSLIDAELSYVNLSNACLKGGVLLYGASLSNAILEGADLTGAQLGAKEELFTLDLPLQGDLDKEIIFPGLRQAFKAKNITLSTQPLVNARISGNAWLITDSGKRYSITKEEKGLTVWGYKADNQAAVLSSAFMPNAVLTGANLYAVNMAGVHWYGEKARADNADLERADLANANLATMNLSQAKMYGCTLDFANLIETDLSGAYLTPTPDLKQSSFVFASIQSANFKEAKLGDAIFTNAAVAFKYENLSRNGGVHLFGLSTSFITNFDSKILSDELEKAFKDNGYPLLDDAAINTVITPGSHWMIKNESQDTSTLHAGYAEFEIIKMNDSLEVYGTYLRVIRRNDGDQLEQVPVEILPTELTEEEMNDNTTCPNGQKLKRYYSKKLTWEQMMTAATPPRPPECVPDPYHWCP